MPNDKMKAKQLNGANYQRNKRQRETELERHLRQEKDPSSHRHSREVATDGQRRSFEKEGFSKSDS